MQGQLATKRTLTQCDKILEYLQGACTLTVEQARDLKFGSNLRSRISDLKRKGYDVRSDYVNVADTYVARYYLYDAFVEKIQEHDNCIMSEFDPLNAVIVQHDLSDGKDVKDMSLAEVYYKLIFENCKIFPF